VEGTEEFSQKDNSENKVGDQIRKGEELRKQEAFCNVDEATTTRKGKAVFNNRGDEATKI